jgi:hypothetical protein
VRDYNERVKQNHLQPMGIPLVTPKSLRINIRLSFRPNKKERLRATEERMPGYLRGYQRQMREGLGLNSASP